MADDSIYLPTDTNMFDVTMMCIAHSNTNTLNYSFVSKKVILFTLISSSNCSSVILSITISFGK